MFRKVKLSKTYRLRRNLEEIANKHGKKLKKIIKVLLPKKALDLGSFIHVIKTSKSKKNSHYCLNCSRA